MPGVPLDRLRSIVVPANPYIRQDRIEFASQSGLQVTFALASLHPALDRWVKMEMAQTEAEWRRKGKNPFTGEEMTFKAKPASKKVRVLPLKNLKAMVN